MRNADESTQEIATLRQQLAELREQLTNAQRMTALGELLSTTTHEFNNILMTVMNYAKLGLRQPDPASRDKAFGRILAAAERAAKITHSVLGMARNRSQAMEPTQLEPLISETLVLLEREMRRYRITVEWEPQPVPAALVHGNQIQQVLLNLLINARQAMPQGGRVSIRLSADEVTGYVDITIRDTGCGISPDRLPRIFEPFHTTKSGPDQTGRGGTGLGLATCRNIIEAHHGRMRVESSVGKGTAFTLRLPIARSAVTTPTGIAILANEAAAPLPLPASGEGV